MSTEGKKTRLSWSGNDGNKLKTVIQLIHLHTSIDFYLFII